VPAGQDTTTAPAAAPALTPTATTTLDVERTFSGKNIVLMGSTGFVGKVVLSMLLCRYPGIGRVFPLVRPGMGNSAEDRFFRKVIESPAFDPLRALYGDEVMDFLRAKVTPIPGDIGRPACNFTDDQFRLFADAGGLHCLVNSAGLVTFTPPLESAIRINVLGVKHALEAARATGAALLHVSTAYVAGRRQGEVWEDEPVIGSFPRQRELLDDDFDAEAELADCQRIIDQVRDRANDRAHISEFRERAAEQLEAEGRDPDDLATLRLTVARQRKLWIHERLTTLGRERAAHWGWANTYTYTKSLGEQILMAQSDVNASIVRPAIVESALRFPFPGWNEGFNTTAPLMYMCLKGHRHLVGRDVPLDIIPVDMVAASILAVTAALIAKENQPVYQLGSSDSNPVMSRRLGELIGLAVRGHYRDKAKAGENALVNHLRARLEAVVVSPETFDRRSAPRIKGLVDGVSRAIDRWLPRWGAPRLAAVAERAQDELGKLSEFTGRAAELIDMFKPFTWDLDIVYRSDNIRALQGRLAPADRERLRWDPETIDWRHYWLDVHFPGLKEHVFPILDEEFGPKPRSVYTYKDLLELFDATTKLHRHRVALRLLRTADEGAEPDVYTYQRVGDMAAQAAAALRQRGVGTDDRVMLMAENRPEWSIAYFGILKADAVAVPVDAQLSSGEVANLIAASGAKVLVVSAKVARRLADLEASGEGDDARTTAWVLAGVGGALQREGQYEVLLVQLADLLEEPALSPAAVSPQRRGDRVASILYTSGTTGDPKGVMLSHKNLTSMVAKLASVFRLYKHDGLLSVLPLHHTFEFSAGLLMPLMRGAQITYLDDLSPDSLNEAFAEGHVTGMIGVPALWQALHRKIQKPFADRGPVAQKLFDTIVELNRGLRDKTPYGFNLGRFLFFPIHGKLGGRMRLLISGGSALPEDVMRTFQGLGFRLFEGYGMTESSPVLTVQRPGERIPLGSVGRALPGVDVKIDAPDASGVGEVIARGPNVMAGYYQNEAATAETLRDGWLRTGDLGRLDEDGNLTIVGRRKEMILGASGENVYPDELEDVYGDSPYVKEMSVVGLPGEDGGETVACLVVPDYEKAGLGRAEVRERVREHIKNVSARLPLTKRIKVLHLWEHDLPKTSTRKVKRREVVKEIQRLERAVRHGASAGGGRAAARASSQPDGAGAGWVLDVIAQVSQRPRSQVTPERRLDELGFDSLMITELGVALEAAGLELPDAGELADLETVADAVRFVAGRPRRGARRADEPRPTDVSGDADEIHVPAPLARVGRRGLRRAQRALYERVLDTKVTGRAFVPPFGGYIAVANHSSHLDMGLVKHALGEQGEALVALAAKDYFFEDPVRRAYFENFTNLVPMERHGSLRESLRLAADVIRAGYILLIFPEGTRSETGIMTDFKPSISYLALNNQCGILPMYLAGTHGAMPKGSFLPRRKAIAAHIGPFLSAPAVRKLGEGLSRSEAYKAVAVHVERIVRGLAPADCLWTLGAAGRAAVADGVGVSDAGGVEE
jgi:long-chain acyl-CoA synthetase